MYPVRCVHTILSCKLWVSFTRSPGIYLVTFGLCLHILWIDRSSAPGHRYVLTAVTLALFVFPTLRIAFGIKHILDAFVYYKGDGGPMELLSDISNWVNVMMGLDYCCQTSIADAFLVRGHIKYRSLDAPEALLLSA